jgi:hypothetical protein
LRQQEPPKATVIPFANTSTDETAVMVKGGNASIANFAMMSTQWWVKLTSFTGLALHASKYSRWGRERIQRAILRSVASGDRVSLCGSYSSGCLNVLHISIVLCI